MALQFGAANQQVACGTFTGPSPVGSVSFWMQLTSDAARNIFGSQTQFSARTVTPHALVNNCHTAGPGELTTGMILSSGPWFHIVLTWDSNTSTQQIYFDGALNVSGGNTNTAPTSVALLLGQVTGGAAGSRFSGLLVDWRVYSRVVTANEVATIYACRGTDGVVFGLITRFVMKELGEGVVASGSGSVKDFTNLLSGTPTGNPPYQGDFIRHRRRV